MLDNYQISTTSFNCLWYSSSFWAVIVSETDFNAINTSVLDIILIQLHIFGICLQLFVNQCYNTLHIFHWLYVHCSGLCNNLSHTCVSHTCNAFITLDKLEMYYLLQAMKCVIINENTRSFMEFLIKITFSHIGKWRFQGT